MRTQRWIGTASLLALAILAPIPVRVSAGNSQPSDERVLVTASDWLEGQGVGVYYTATPYDDHPMNEDGTIQYECVELAVRLYAKLGYTRRWPINWAYQVAGLPGRREFPDWMFLQNGGPVPPRQGDIVVWPWWYNGGTGHVAIVDRVDGSSVRIVHQNVWWGREPKPLSEMILHHGLQNGQGRFTLVGRDGSWPIGWVHSARMEIWLSQQYPVALAAMENAPPPEDGAPPAPANLVNEAAAPDEAHPQDVAAPAQVSSQ
ncbi:MAG: CHAP domain-containing protein [Chloroflexi bacterium]|nr:CHAP domain-containing protein [Chloroflexota bacterium]